MSVLVSVILGHKGTDVFTIERDATVADALKKLADHNVGALVVADRPNAVAGIVSERDIVRRLARSGSEALDVPVSEVMTTDVLTCTAEATADDVMQTMTTHRMRHLPVIDAEGLLVGIVSIGDVVKSRIDELETQAQAMQDYITASP